MTDSNPLVAIVGPTASGKSALALEIASRWQGEILNCDSVQVYRGFDIGSGKLSPEERRGIPHHLLDIADPREPFTAGDYRREALRVLHAVRERGHLPVIVGGTGLYLRALLSGLFEGPSRSDELRSRLRGIAALRGGEFLHRLLIRFDPVAAARIHPRDRQKVMRALEVFFLCRAPISRLWAQGRSGLRGFRPIKIGLNPERVALYDRINRRVERLYAAGWLDEVRTLLSHSDAEQWKPLGALGYPEACAVLRGKMSCADAIRQTQAATRHYAKRQLTWFRREPGVRWFQGFGDDAEIQMQVFTWLKATLSATREPSSDREEP